FCSKSCAERFSQDPGKFLAASSTAGMGHSPASAGPGAIEDTAAAASPDEKKVRYTCPMHPQVVQVGPGICPICGMALEPMDIFAEVEADPEYHAMLLRFWVSAALALPVLVFSMIGESFDVHLSPNVRNGVE